MAGKRTATKQRVCDSCLPPVAQTRSRRSSACSADSHFTLPSESLVTPDHDDWVLAHTASISRSSTRSNLDVAEPVDELAPVEPWMGPSGILSLYPLAVNPSHAVDRLVPAPAAGPLFAPSIAARRCAMEKEMERTNLRQRRLGGDKTIWIPEVWGYRREDFDPTFYDEDVEGQKVTEGGLVVDGPIRFRAQVKRSSVDSDVLVV